MSELCLSSMVIATSNATFLSIEHSSGNRIRLGTGRWQPFLSVSTRGPARAAVGPALGWVGAVYGLVDDVLAAMEAGWVTLRPARESVTGEQATERHTTIGARGTSGRTLDSR